MYNIALREKAEKTSSVNRNIRYDCRVDSSRWRILGDNLPLLLLAVAPAGPACGTGKVLVRFEEGALSYGGAHHR